MQEYVPLTQTTDKMKTGKFIVGAGLLMFVVGLTAFLLRARLGLHLFEFGDETEKFVAAQMINNGQHLYRDIFAHHGPVAYMVAHIYTILVSPNNFNRIRIFQVLLALVSCAALLFTPVLRTPLSRLWAAGCYLCLLSSVWIVQGMHMILYQQIGGFLLTLSFLHVFAPLFFGTQPSWIGLFASGLSVVVSCFTAYAFGPSSVMLVLSSVLLLFVVTEKGERGRLVSPFVVGLLLGVAGVLLWMFLYADLKGFYVYHFYFNQHVYAQYIRFSSKDLLNVFSFSLEQKAVVHTLALSLFVVWFVSFLVMSFQKTSFRLVAVKGVALLLFAASVLLMNPRGGLGFHDNGFIISVFSLFALTSALLLQWCVERNFRAGMFGTLVVAVFVMLFLDLESKDVLSSPQKIPRSGWRKQQVSLAPEERGVYGFVRSFTKKEGDFLALLFEPIHYIKTDRLPASGHYYYLPWQASYGHNPVAGYKIDICRDIASNSPAVIWFNNIKIGGYLPVAKYEPCVLAALEKDYVALRRDPHIHIRRELLADDAGTVQEKETFTMHRGPAGGDSKEIQLRMSGRQMSGLKRIGVFFGKLKQRQGEGILRLRASDGREFAQSFELSELTDDAYRYFDIDSGEYVWGKIELPVQGDGEVWESRSAKGDTFTCITYEYGDGRRGFTPGCPLY